MIGPDLLASVSQAPCSVLGEFLFACSLRLDLKVFSLYKNNQLKCTNSANGMAFMLPSMVVVVVVVGRLALLTGEQFLSQMN